MRPHSRVVNSLRTAIRNRGLSRTQVAELTGIPYRRLLRIVRPDSDPPLGQALRIGAVLDLRIEHVFRLDPSATSPQPRRSR